MRKWAILLLLAAMVPAALPEKPVTTQMVTVEQLEQALATVHGVRDGRLAKQISDMKLTQRLSDARLARLEKELPGPQARQALVALADESQFLDLPAADIPSTAVPSAAGQAELLARTMDYVKTAVAKLPDFYATRTTTRFVGTPLVIPKELHDALFWNLESNSFHRRLMVVGATSITDLYRDGHEVQAVGKKEETLEPGIIHGLTTVGEFGEILASVPEIAAHGKVVWSHWELGAAGLQAVFHYETAVSISMSVENSLGGASRENTRFSVSLGAESSLGDASKPEYFVQRGEIAVNPADGSILRITIINRWKANWVVDHMEEEYIMVEYGPVEIGGMTYICPVRSVVLQLSHIFFVDGDKPDRYNRRHGLSELPVHEDLNDVSFGQYHVFRAEMRILPGDTPVPEATPPAPTSATPAHHAPGTAPQR